jgi:Lhr-like helicase
MKLTLLEVSILFSELNGRITNDATKQREGGLLSNKLPIRIKYVIQNELNLKLQKELEAMEKELMEVFKELGVQDGEQYTIADENRQEFLKRQFEISNIEVEIPVPDIDINELLKIETDEYWPILLDKLLKKE